MNNFNFSHCCKNQINSSYIKWLLELLGPVIIGSKPCEIISIANHDINRNQKLDDINKYFNSCKRIQFIKVEKENSSKILFINKFSLSNTLKCPKCRNFLKFLGYPQNIDVDLYLNHLLSRLEENNFPNEIGIFLGYPIKDVVGFMGYGKNKLYNTKYWKIYGDPKPSEEIYDKFLYHREKIRNLIINNDVANIISAMC